MVTLPVGMGINPRQGVAQRPRRDRSIRQRGADRSVRTPRRARRFFPTEIALFPRRTIQGNRGREKEGWREKAKSEERTWPLGFRLSLLISSEDFRVDFSRVRGTICNGFNVFS